MRALTGGPGWPGWRTASRSQGLMELYVVQKNWDEVFSLADKNEGKFSAGVFLVLRRRGAMRARGLWLRRLCARCACVRRRVT